MSRHGPSRFRRALITIAVGVAAFALPTGVAQAYWMTTGSGTGTATAGTVSSLTGLTGTAAATGTLVPGGTGSLVVAVQNPNTVPITVTAISTGSVAVTVQGAAGACSTSDPAISLLAPSAGLPFTVPAGGTLSVTLSNAVAMATTAKSGCQSATFGVPVTLTGRTN
jgi:hypothetical protein